MEMPVQVFVPINTKFLLGFPDLVNVLSRKTSVLPSNEIEGLPLRMSAPRREGERASDKQYWRCMQMSGRGNKKSRKSYGRA